ncbi:MAG: hypothetical protein ABR584_05910 [Candidatus Baltobacteraceae bacterium]
MKARVTVIAAPPGFGKTVALGDARKNITGTLISLDLNAHIDTLPRFTYELGQAVVPAALSPEHTQADFLTLLKNARATIFIDQLHYTQEPRRVAQFLQRAVLQCGEALRWVLVMRDPADFPIECWMAEGLCEVPINAEALRFDLHDVARAAARMNVERTHKQIKELLVRTGGWPMGVMFALRGETPLPGPESARELSWRIFEGRSDRERQFLLSTCLLPSVNSELCAAAGWADAPELLVSMQDDAPFIFVGTGEALQYHEAFAQFLQATLKDRGAVALGAVLEIAGSVLEELGRVHEALLLYTRFPVVSEIARLLERHRQQMLEQGHSEIVQRALAMVEAT